MKVEIKLIQLQILEKRLIERWRNFNLPKEKIDEKVYKNDLPNGVNVLKNSTLLKIVNFVNYINKKKEELIKTENLLKEKEEILIKDYNIHNCENKDLNLNNKINEEKKNNIFNKENNIKNGFDEINKESNENNLNKISEIENNIFLNKSKLDKYNVFILLNSLFLLLSNRF